MSRRLIPQLSFADLQLQNLGIHLDPSLQRIADFLKQRGVKNLEPWLDEKNELPAHYEIQTLPTTILYDAGGREVWRYIGGKDWAGAEAAKLLAEGRS